jgi:Ca2+-binding RTX toxin-like protein
MSYKPAKAAFTNGADSFSVTVTSTYQSFDMLGGNDTATVDFSGMADWSYNTGATANSLVVTSYGLVVLNILNVENFHFIDGGLNSNLAGFDGNDIIEGRGGADTLYDSGGLDQFYGGDGDDGILLNSWTAGKYIDGGTGFDYVALDRTYVSTDLVYNDLGATLSGGPTIVNSEIRGIYTGSGNDSVSIHWGPTWQQFFSGDAGSDTSILDFAAANNAIRFYQDSIDWRFVDIYHPGAGFTGDFEVLAQINTDVENITVIGSAFNDIFYDAPSVTNTFLGGGGTDTVHYLGAMSEYSISFNASNSYFTISAGPEGSIDYINGVESFEFSDGIRTADQLKPPLLPNIIVWSGDTILDNTTTTSAAAGTDFGSAVQNSSSVTKTYFIRNMGDGDLLLSNLVMPAGFTLLNPFSGTQTLHPLDIISLNVVVDTSTAGTKTGQISFTTNQTGVETFNFTITGQVTAMTGVIGDNAANVIHGDGNANTINGLGGSDTLFGHESADQLYGGNQDDHLYGGAGGDLLNGGNGFDFAHYEDSLVGLVLSLRQPWDNSGDAAGDQYVSIEGLVGTNFVDTLFGDDNQNSIYGLNGADTIAGFGGNDYLYGGDGIDIFYGGTGADTMVGGTGNDLYEVDNVGDTVIELAGAANGTADNVYAYVDYTLATGVDNLIMLYGNQRYGTGNATDNIIYGNSQLNILQGGAGYDTLIGGAGSDYFIVNAGFGVDVISDFTAGAGSQDAIVFSKSLFTTFAGVLSHAAQVGADTWIGDGFGNTVVLSNVLKTNLHADDFQFA